ncbi:MAG TPA: thioredoxin family protein, partial [Spirochaetota bacterium]|nr:thioredoxin family protein [Spirochaetota bacterium]
AVATAHRIALENPKIKADMVESSTFQHLAIKYNVSSVPKIVINETHEIIGAQPVSVFLEEIEKL